MIARFNPALPHPAAVEPVTIEIWRDAGPSTRIVFIVRNIAREFVESLFTAVGPLAQR